MKLHVKKLNENARLPARSNPTDAGLDLFADVGGVVFVGGRTALHTGIAVAVPEGYYGRIAPRSGLAAKHGIDVLAGVVDSSYRGEIRVVLHNTSDKRFTFNRGDRIAQLIIEKIALPEVEEVEELEATSRGDGGFGSTGK